MAQMVKRWPVMLETRVRSLGWEDPLEKERATHSLPGKSHGQRSLVGYSPWGLKESDRAERLYLSLLYDVIRLVKYTETKAEWWLRGAEMGVIYHITV